MELQEFITSTSIIFRTGNGNDVVISKDKIGRHCNDLFNNVHESYFDDEKSKTTMKLEDEADKENRLDQGLEEDYNDETIDEMLLDFLASDTFQQQQFGAQPKNSNKRVLQTSNMENQSKKIKYE